MIKVNLLCGLGNQMFEYAYARALSEEFNDETIVINDLFDSYVQFYVYHKFKSTPIGLKNLCLNENVRYARHNLSNFLSSTMDFIDYAYYHQDLFRGKFTQKIYEKRSSRGKYQQAKGLPYTYFAHSKITRKNKLVSDLFQSELYFKNIRYILLDEFKVKNEPSAKNAKMINELLSCNAVCVHVRRGDILESYWSFLNVCNERYYQRGMDYIAQHTENPVFYIFSNTSKDLEWIKENYHFTYPVKYVDLGNPAHEDYRLMYNCKHFIISNSTFSWWASYMSENKDKIVVAPDIWIKTPYEGGTMDIYRDDMIKIHVSLEENK